MKTQKTKDVIEAASILLLLILVLDFWVFFAFMFLIVLLFGIVWAEEELNK